MKLLNKVAVGDERISNGKFNIQRINIHKISNKITIDNFIKNKKIKNEIMK